MRYPYLKSHRQNYLNEELCKRCGRRCCLKMPGATSPEDFKKPLLSSLIAAFKTGMWAIDWFEGDPTGKGKIDKGYYVRPAIRGVNELFDPSWGGACIFLTPKGCKLPPSKRPLNCRMLEPRGDGCCVLHIAGKCDIAIKWLLSHDIILKAAEEAQK